MSHAYEWYGGEEVEEREREREKERESEREREREREKDEINIHPDLRSANRLRSSDVHPVWGPSPVSGSISRAA